MGLEPATLGVTGRYSKQLSYHRVFMGFTNDWISIKCSIWNQLHWDERFIECLMIADNSRSSIENLYLNFGEVGFFR